MCFSFPTTTTATTAETEADTKVIFRICVCDICEFVMERGEADVLSDLKAKAVAAVEEGDVLVLEQLLRESDLDLSTITTAIADRSLLMVACQHKQLHVVKWLCEHGNVSVEVEDRNGRTALQFACSGAVIGVIDLDVVRVMIELLGADVEHCDRGGVSPLWRACGSVSLDVLRYLIEECDADVERVANKGWTPFRLACYCSSDAVMECLSERTDCDISDCDRVGYGEKREAKRQYMRSVWQLNV